LAHNILCLKRRQKENTLEIEKRTNVANLMNFFIQIHPEKVK